MIVTLPVVSPKKRYYEANREKIAAWGKRYYETHREYVLERGKEWVRANPDKRRESNRRYLIRAAMRTWHNAKAWMEATSGGNG